MKLLIAIILLLSLTGCATSLEKGNAAYKKSQYMKAANHYAECGRQGNPVCINNLGYIHYLAGNTDNAIEHYKLAARMGDTYAINNLKQLGEAPPDQDLVSYQPKRNYSAVAPATDDLFLLMGIVGSAYGGNSNQRSNCTSLLLGDIIQTNCR